MKNKIERIIVILNQYFIFWILYYSFRIENYENINEKVMTLSNSLLIISLFIIPLTLVYNMIEKSLNYKKGFRISLLLSLITLVIFEFFVLQKGENPP